jgi:hypothetical protein
MLDINSLGHRLLQTIKSVQVLLDQAESKDAGNDDELGP